MGSVFNERYGRLDDLELFACNYGIRDCEGYYPMEPGKPLFDENDNRPMEEAIECFNHSKFGSQERKSAFIRILSILNGNYDNFYSYLVKNGKYEIVSAVINKDNIECKSCFLKIPGTNSYIDLFNLDGSVGRVKICAKRVKKLLDMITFDCSNSLEEALERLKKNKYVIIDGSEFVLQKNPTFKDVTGYSAVIKLCKHQPINIYKDSETNDLLVPVHGGFIRLIDYTPARFRMLHLIPSSLNGMFFIPEDNVNATYFDSYTRKTLRKIAFEQRRNR